MKKLASQKQWRGPIEQGGPARRFRKQSRNNTAGRGSDRVVHVDGTSTEFEKLGPHCCIETVESPTDPAKTLLAIYEGGTVRLAEQFEWNGQVFLPKPRGRGAFNLVRLPKGAAAAYESASSLIARTSELLCTCIDIDPTLAELVSAFILSSWFPENLVVAPYLALVGLPRSGKTQMLRLLAMLCRHSIAITDITSAAVYRLYKTSIPTLLIDETNTAGDQKKLAHLLRSGSTPGFLALRKGASFNCYGPKAFAWMELPKDRALITRCVVIPMHETDRINLKRVVDPGIQSAAEDLQKQFLQLRLERFSKPVAVEPNISLHSRNRDLYEALTFPIADDKDLCAKVASLLWKQEQFTREPFSVSQAAVLTALMAGVHLPQITRYYVGDLATSANKLLTPQNENNKLTPHMVGNILTSFGIHNRKRTNRGWLLEFDQSLRRNVHVLVKRHGTECGAALFDSPGSVIFADCSICNELKLVTNSGSTKGRAKPERFGALGELSALRELS